MKITELQATTLWKLACEFQRTGYGALIEPHRAEALAKKGLATILYNTRMGVNGGDGRFTMTLAAVTEAGMQAALEWKHGTSALSL